MGRAKAKAEAVQLVRRVPCGEKLWLKSRWGRARVFRSFMDCYVELRSSALLLYKASGPGRTNGDTQALIDKPPNKFLEMVPLREASILSVEKTLTITVKKPDLSGTVDLRFDKKQTFDRWALNLRELAGLRHTTLADFTIERHVGKGASGRVYLVRERETDEALALKVIEKESVYESTDAYRHALDERIVLELATKHPFILDMRYAFQNRERLFLVTEYCGGGDLFEYLNKKSRPMEECKARYISAEILLAIEHVHKLGAVYRDLKLENVLLDEDGHIRVADFGLSKLLTSRNAKLGDGPLKLERTKTFCGTREYVAPEMLSGSLYDTSVDLWAFGILLYEILCGRTPFYSRQRNEIYDRIEKAPVFYPKDMSEEVQDLLRGLLNRDVNKRLGTGPGGIGDIKAHPWFAAIDWDDLYSMKPHVNSIAQEIREIRCGKGSPSSGTSNCKRTKRHLAQEKAMQTLTSDWKNDVEAMQKATSRTALSAEGDNAPSLSSRARTREHKVVPVSESRRKSAMLAGYSFCGTLEMTKDDTVEFGSTGTSAAGPSVYRNASEGFEKSNVLTSSSPSNGPVASLEDSAVTEKTVPDRTNVTSVHAAVPSLGTMKLEDRGNSDELLSPASQNLDDLIDKVVETRRESGAPPRSMNIPSPSFLLKRRHEKRLIARQRKQETS